MQYETLQLAASYPEVINLRNITGITDTLTKITPALFCAFKIRYGGTKNLVTRLIYPYIANIRTAKEM